MYTFDFSQLPFNARTPHRTPARAHDAVQAHEPPVHEQAATTRKYQLVREVPDTLPTNCTAVYYTDRGTWLELEVGPLSVAGQPELPDAKIFRITRTPDRPPEPPSAAQPPALH